MIDLESISKQSGIYKIINKIKNKVYIGQAVNLKQRIQTHLNSVKKTHNYPLYHSMRKHGVENFDVEILIQEKNLTKQELDDLEIDFIRLYNSIDRLFGYNLTKGGEGTVGFKFTKESKDKMSKTKKGKPCSQEHKQKISKTSKGRIFSQEHKKKLSNAAKNRKPISKETINKIRQTKIKNQTDKHSEKTKEKMRQVNLGRKHSEESKNKMREIAKNRKPISEETRQKMKESQKGKKQTLQHVEKVKKAKKLKKAQKLIQENCLYQEYFYDNFIYKS